MASSQRPYRFVADPGTKQLHGTVTEQLGWTDGHNVRFNRRWGEGNADVTRRQAAELVALAPEQAAPNMVARLGERQGQRLA